MLLGNPSREDLHFLHRLLVAFALGGGDAVTIRGERFVGPPFGRKRLPEQLPRGRITCIEAHRLTQMDARARRIAQLQLMLPQPTTPTRAPLAPRAPLLDSGR